MKSTRLGLLLILLIACLAGCDGTESLEKGPVLVGIAGPTATWNYYEQTAALVITGQGAIDQELCSSLFFQNTVRRLIVEEGITEIGLDAFAKCSSLESVTFPDTLKIIESRSFYECTALKKVILPEGVVIVGMRAFKGCESLVQVVLPSTITRVESTAFEACDALTDMTVPPHLEEWARINGFRE